MFKALETPHFIVYREVGLPAACPSLGEWLEGYYSVFGDYLGVQRPSGRKIAYKQYAQLGAARDACRGAAVNCYLSESETIVSVEALYPHEIAHVFERLVGGSGSAPRFFSEGLASALGGGFGYDRSDHRVDSSLPLEDLLDDAAFWSYVSANGPEVIYGSAAAFVRYLINVFGKDAFLSFYGALDGVTQGAAIERIFSQSFGVALRDTIQTWRTGPQPIVEDLLLVSAGCEISPQVRAGATLNVDPECSQRGFQFDVATSGRQDLILDGSGGFVQLRSCSLGDLLPSSGLSFGLSGSPALEIRVALDVPPGRYEGIVSQGPTSVTVSPAPITLDLDGSCSADRIPAAIGGQSDASIAVIRRWGTTEMTVGFDVSVQADGPFEISSGSNTGVAQPDSTAPRTFYLCPAACVSDPDQDCARDDIVEILNGQDSTHDVFEVPVKSGDLLHFETGPRAIQDWAYSVRLRVGQ